ncbi:hypothetical protein [Sphingomonas faeni]|uniref:hypothetical protein n=1 Tax=Sphingomonas faeni TaxID=185950 RepID=UPI00335BD1F8
MFSLTGPKNAEIGDAERRLGTIGSPRARQISIGGKIVATQAVPREVEEAEYAPIIVLPPTSLRLT